MHLSTILGLLSFALFKVAHLFTAKANQVDESLLFFSHWMRDFGIEAIGQDHLADDFRRRPTMNGGIVPKQIVDTEHVFVNRKAGAHFQQNLINNTQDLL